MRNGYTYSECKPLRIPTTEQNLKHARVLLKGYGFTDEETHCEYHIRLPNLPRWKIDIVGIKEDDSFSVAIELGMCSPDKLMPLLGHFNEVIWLPYWGTRMNPDVKLEEKRLEELAQETRELKRTLVILQADNERIIREAQTREEMILGALRERE